MENIKQYNIVIVGQQPWDVEIGSNCKNIAIELSRNNRVLYVNSPLKRGLILNTNHDKKIQKRLAVVKKKESALVQLNDNLWTLYPDSIIESVSWLPDNFIFDLFNKNNNRRFAFSIKKAIKTLNFKDFILFNDNEIYDSFYLKEFLNPKFSIYYSRDFMLGVDFWKKHGTRLEPKLIAKSDIAISNSLYLTNYCKKYNPKSYYVGQGCDFDLFSDLEQIEIPQDIKELSNPIIGYVGSISSSRLDIDIIKTLAINNPSWNIVLVGPEDDEFKKSDLHLLKNVYFLGSKAIEILPAYIKNFTVCINPQILNEITIGNYPRKIDEYLAAGKPVVATATEAMNVFKQYVFLANNIDEYQELIEEALATDNENKQNERKKFALSHTWENSVNQIYKAIALNIK